MIFLMRFPLTSGFFCQPYVFIILCQQKIRYYSIKSMLSHLQPSTSPRPSPYTKPSPPKPHFLTIGSGRPATLSPRQEQIIHGAMLAPSPTDRNRQKIRLISPLRCVNRSNLTTKENSPSQLVANKPVNACSPFKPVGKIELGGSPKRPMNKNFNEISNISIKQHLETSQRQTSPNRPAVTNKYSAFVIMGPALQTKTVQRTTVSPFRKRQNPHIIFNNKSFNTSSLKSQIIHVAPFHHIQPSQLHPQIIHEETQNSTLKESCEEELREVREFRKEMEAESSRMREVLKTSKVSHEVCVSQLVYASQEERAQKRNPSKLFNFQDVPLHQSRIKTEEKLFIPHQICAKIEQSSIQNVDKNHLQHKEQEAVHLTLPQQLLPHVQLDQNLLGRPKLSRESWGNSQKTLINELNFLTVKKLTVENSKDQVCVQTETIKQDQGGERTTRQRLAIVRNEECLINLCSNADNHKPLAQVVEVEACIDEDPQIVPLESEKQMLTVQYDHQQADLSIPTPLVKQQVIKQQVTLEQVTQEQPQLVFAQEPQSNHHVEDLIQQPIEQTAQQHPGNQYFASTPSIASELVIVELQKSQVESNPPSHGRAESNLSLQLEPMTKQPDTQVGHEISGQAPENKAFSNIMLQQAQKKAESGKEITPILSLRSARSGTGKESWTKRGAASKRSIHNSIYL